MGDAGNNFPDCRPVTNDAWTCGLELLGVVGSAGTFLWKVGNEEVTLVMCTR